MFHDYHSIAFGLFVMAKASSADLSPHPTCKEYQEMNTLRMQDHNKKRIFRKALLQT